MLGRIVCLTLLLTTSLSICATAAEAIADNGIVAKGIEALGNPWMIEQEDGSLRIGLAFAPGVDPLQLGAIRVLDQDRQLLSVSPSWQLKRQGLVGEQQRMIYSFQLSNVQRHATRHIEIHTGPGRVLHLHLPQQKQKNEAANILCIGQYNYPLIDDIKKIEASIQDNIDLVVIIGKRCVDHLGTGTWEQRIPLLVMHEADTPESVIQSERFICGKAPAWPSGFSYACLAFPSADHDDLNLAAINRADRAWKIFIDRHARWDPAISSSRALDAKRMRRLFAVATRQQMPFVLGGGSGALFISEPLFVESYQFAEIALRNQYINEMQYELVKKTVSDSGRSVRSVMLEMGLLNRNQVETISQGMINKPMDVSVLNELEGMSVKAGGTRYVAVNSAGISFRPLDKEIAVPVYEKSFVLVQAQPQHCELKVFTLSGKQISVSYSKDMTTHNPGWGTWDPAQKQLDKSKLSELSNEEVSHLVWLTHLNLNGAFASSSYRLHTSLDFAHKMSKQNNDLLLRRLMQLNAVVALSWVYQQEDVAVDVRRDALLRNLADPQAIENHDFQDLIVNNSDPLMLRSILDYLNLCTKEHRLALIDLLIKRLKKQVDGKLALEKDPLLQHQLMTCIFESPYHSPTPLRPLAHYMREHGHPFAVGASSPVQRFFDRHGEEEP